MRFETPVTGAAEVQSTVMGVQSTAEVEQFVRSLAELHQVVDAGAETDALLHAVATEAARILEAESTTLLLLDEDRRRLVLSAAHGLTESQAAQLTFRPGEGIAGWVVDHERPLLIADTTQDVRFVPLVSPARPVRSVLAVPIQIRGRTVGVLCANHETPDWFTDAHRSLLSFLVSSAVLALENARLYRLALTDPLTGLHNRQHLCERLREEVDRSHRYGQPLSILMLDLDHFTDINSARGRSVGDVVIRVVAQRMQSALREVDLLARYEGQVFVAVLPNTSRPGAERAADRILDALRTGPIETDDGPVTITASVGGAVLGSREEARDLLIRADAALYQAKSQGRDRAVFNWLCFASVS